MTNEEIIMKVNKYVEDYKKERCINYIPKRIQVYENVYSVSDLIGNNNPFVFDTVLVFDKDSGEEVSKDYNMFMGGKKSLGNLIKEIYL